MATSIRSVFQGQLPVEVLDKIENSINQFNADGTLNTVAAATIGGNLTVTGTVTATGSATTAGSQTLTTTAVATTTTDILAINNTTAALVGAQVQDSPAISLAGAGWDTDGVVSVPVRFYEKVIPVAGTTVTGKLSFLGKVGAGVVVEAATIDTAGNLTAVGDIGAVGGFKNTVGPFVITDAQANQTGAATFLGFSDGAWVAPFGGSIMALQTSVSTKASGSDIVFSVTKNGSIMSGVAHTISNGGGTTNYSTFAKDDKTFAAGDLLRVVYSTLVGFTSTTQDSVTFITVEF